MPHTPGPWRVHSEHVDLIIVNGCCVYQVRELTTDDGHPSPADVRLMAAAPDLLAACVEAVSAITYLLSNNDDDPNYAATLHTLAAVLAKAEGRQ